MLYTVYMLRIYSASSFLGAFFFAGPRLRLVTFEDFKGLALDAISASSRTISYYKKKLALLLLIQLNSEYLPSSVPG